MDECIKQFEFFWGQYSSISSRFFKSGKITTSQEHIDINFNKVIDYVAMMLVSIAKDMYGENAIKFVEKGYELNQIPRDDSVGKSNTDEIVKILINVKPDELLLRIRIVIRKPEQFPEVLAGYFATVNCYKAPRDYSSCKPIVEFISFMEEANKYDCRKLVKNIVCHNTLVSAKIALCSLILQWAYRCTINDSTSILDIIIKTISICRSNEEDVEIAKILRSTLRENKEKVLEDINKDNAMRIFIALCQ
jgi:hypothetical protein